MPKVGFDKVLQIEITDLQNVSVNIANGIDPYIPVDSPRSGSRIDSTSHSLRPIAQLYNLTSTAVKALSRHAIIEEEGPPSQLSSLVNVFDQQICALANQYNQSPDIRKDLTPKSM